MERMPYQLRLEHKLCSEVHRARIRGGGQKLQQWKFQLDIRKKWFIMSGVSTGAGPQRGGNLVVGEHETLSSLI